MKHVHEVFFKRQVKLLKKRGVYQRKSENVPSQSWTEFWSSQFKKLTDRLIERIARTSVSLHWGFSSCLLVWEPGRSTDHRWRPGQTPAASPPPGNSVERNNVNNRDKYNSALLTGENCGFLNWSWQPQGTLALLRFCNMKGGFQMRNWKFCFCLVPVSASWERTLHTKILASPVHTASQGWNQTLLLLSVSRTRCFPCPAACRASLPWHLCRRCNQRSLVWPTSGPAGGCRRGDLAGRGHSQYRGVIRQRLEILS